MLIRAAAAGTARTRLGRLATLLVLLAVGGAAPAAAEVFCTADGRDPRIEMTPTTALPWGAVGFVNNGCTATLISQSYLLTAGHCVTNVGDGSWQGGLSFFPNHHPSVTRPSYRIDRAVVGARVDVGPLDWAIAHLDKPVTDFPFIPLGDPPDSAPFSVSLGGYGRDLNRTSPQPAPAGAPCANAFCPGGNVWWDFALVQPRCTVRSETARELLTDCSVVGGNSGSPFILNAAAANARVPDYKLVGVIHGGSPALLDWSKDAPSRQAKQLLPVCTALSKADDAGNLNGGPSARHFRYAPLLASDVAVVRASATGTASIVLESDADAARVVVRERLGTTLKHPYSDHRFFGFLLRPTRLAGLVRPDGNPAVAAVASNGRLFVRQAEAPGDWGNWTELARPKGVAKVEDVDGDLSELYAVGGDGRAYRTRLGAKGWEAWKSMGGTGLRRIAAVRDAEGVRHVLTVNAAGAVAEHVQNGKAWDYAFKAPVTLTGATKVRDLDVVRDTGGRFLVYGVDAGGGLWTRTTLRGYAKPEGSGDLGWAAWSAWDVRLYAPEVADKKKASATAEAQKYGFWPEVGGPRLDGVNGLTAAILPEKWAKTMKNLVVFATDKAGNVYLTGRRCATSAVASCYWSGWRPFTE